MTRLFSADDDRDRRDERLPANDPLALFHQIQLQGQPAARAAETEVAAMKAAVAELRRARELSRRSELLDEDAAPAAAAASRPWRLAAAAVALFATAVFFGGSPAPAPPAASKPAAVQVALSERASHLPLVEDLDPRQAELIQIEDEGMSLVVVMAAGPF